MDTRVLGGSNSVPERTKWLSYGPYDHIISMGNA